MNLLINLRLSFGTIVNFDKTEYTVLGEEWYSSFYERSSLLTNLGGMDSNLFLQIDWIFCFGFLRFFVIQRLNVTFGIS